jgi:hypothetical protein
MTTAPTTPEALAFCDKAFKMMAYLYERWADEKDYEDLNEYLEPLRPVAVETGVELLAMTKRPFGVKYRVAGKTFHAFIKGGTYGYKRIA